MRFSFLWNKLRQCKAKTNYRLFWEEINGWNSLLTYLLWKAIKWWFSRNESGLGGRGSCPQFGCFPGKLCQEASGCPLAASLWKSLSWQPGWVIPDFSSLWVHGVLSFLFSLWRSSCGSSLLPKSAEKVSHLASPGSHRVPALSWLFASW